MPTKIEISPDLINRVASTVRHFLCHAPRKEAVLATLILLLPGGLLLALALVATKTKARTY